MSKVNKKMYLCIMRIKHLLLTILSVVALSACNGKTGSSTDNSIFGIWTYEIPGFLYEIQFNPDYTGRYRYVIGTVENSVTFHYVHDPASNRIQIFYDDGQMDVMTIIDRGPNTMHISLGGNEYNLIRSGEAPEEKVEPEEPVTDYAPANASGYHFVLNYNSSVLDLYFDSNSSINPASSYSQFALESATYSKTDVNKASLVYVFKGPSGSATRPLVLTFTSYSGGTYTYEFGQQGTFTFAREEPTVIAESPSSIAYKRFTVNPGTSTQQWFQLGEEGFVYYDVTSFNLGTSISSSYHILDFTYSKTGTSTAKITYTERYQNSSYPNKWTYYLSFRSETDGTYDASYTTNNPYASTLDKDRSGNFTLR